MFHFALDLKDAMRISGATLAKFQVAQDREFEAEHLRSFKAAHPDHAVEDSEDFFELDERVNRAYFVAREITPKSAQEAVEFVRQFCFFPPLAVWIDGVEHDCLNYVGDDLVRVSV